MSEELDRTIEKANKAAPDYAEEAGKSVSAAIDSENKKRREEKEKKFNRDVREISKSTARRVTRNPTIFIFNGNKHKKDDETSQSDK